MSAELNWGLPVVSYLFLAGLGAGALTVSATIFLRSNGDSGTGHFNLARYGALLAPVPIIIGCFLLIFELGSFERGEWFKWLNLYKGIYLSPMSIGTWLLTFFIIISLVYAYTFWRSNAARGDQFEKLRKATAWIGIPMGIGVAVYTGVLLGAMPSRPLWNTPILSILFLISALSTGIAIILLARALMRKGESADKNTVQSSYLLTASDATLIGLELLVVLLFIMFALFAVGDVKYASSVLLFGNTSVEMFGVNLASMFWFWVVGVGLLLPAAIELFYVAPKLIYQKAFAVPRSVEFLTPVFILVGGFMLRYVVVVAGQVTGSVGI